MTPFRIGGNTQLMSPVHRFLNLAGVLLPLLGFVAAVVLLWGTDLVGWTDLGLFAVFYVLTGYGVTLGFHRLLTHRSFQTHKWVEYALAVTGSMAVQGPVMSWVADHRKHHAHTDQEGDPHSPHGHGAGFKGAVAGLWYAHMGWLFDRAGQAEHARYARDLYDDRGMGPDRAGDRVRGRRGGRGEAGRRPDRRGVGRRGARVHAPPRHLVDQ